MREIQIVLTQKMLEKPIVFEFPKEIVFVNRANVGLKNEREHNLIGFARREKYVKDLVIRLAKNGFFLVSSSKGNSKFQKFTTACNFKNNLKVKNLQIYKDLFYTLESPKIDFASPRLLVVFSSVADLPYNADIARRNFFVNFPSISKYIPNNTYILRISDIGGIIGSFYMNTNFSNTIEENIQNLIKTILKSKNIAKEDVVLYGGSKGGTAALYHGILGRYKVASVDPIVSDKYHEEQYNDSHFTQNSYGNKIYIQTKQEKFIQFIKNRDIPNYINIIYSKQSPVYNDINSIIRDNDVEKKINFINLCHPSIKEHPDVAKNSINILMLLINNLFYNIGKISSKDIDC
jgi:hypothetical protein